MCSQCENHVHIHQGPVGVHRGYYQVREIAAALVSIAGGITYAETARRVRTNYWGVGGTGRLSKETHEGGQTIADWLNQYGPMISEHYAETEWPETIVLDSTEYQYTDPQTGDQSQLFVILAAWGYEEGAARGRLWKVEARPRDQKDDWIEFLRALPGKPKLVVYDGDKAIGPAVTTRWRGKVPAQVCEYHLHKNAFRAWVADEQDGYTPPERELLNHAFRSLVEWKAFTDAVAASGGPTLVGWVGWWDKKLTTQVERRSSLPAHYSTGALDRAIDIIRQVTERRKWTFRNKERMNQLLDLVRLRINRQDDAEKWAALIREYVEAHGGRPPGKRQLADPFTLDPSGKRVYSLWG